MLVKPKYAYSKLENLTVTLDGQSMMNTQTSWMNVAIWVLSYTTRVT